MVQMLLPLMEIWILVDALKRKAMSRKTIKLDSRYDCSSICARDTERECV